MTANLAEGLNWQTRIEKGRVRTLARLGLAEKVGFGQWRLDNNLERASYSDPVYDPAASLAKPVTGRVVSTGVLDDVNDRTYMIVDTVHGEAIFVDTGRAENIAAIETGMIVKAGP